MENKKRLVLEELKDGWQLRFDGAVLAKFGKGSLQNDLAIQSMVFLQKEHRLGDQDILVKSHSIEGNEFGYPAQIETISNDSWKMPPETFFVENSPVLDSIETKARTWTNLDEVLLRAGEMSEQERLTSMAVLKGFARDIRSSIEKFKKNNLSNVNKTNNEFQIKGFVEVNDYENKGRRSLAYRPEGDPLFSLEVRVTDKSYMSTSISSNFEVELLGAGGVKLYSKHSDNFTDAVSQAGTLVSVSRMFNYIVSEQPDLTDDMLEFKRDPRYSIQISHFGSEPQFTAFFFEEESDKPFMEEIDTSENLVSVIEKLINYSLENKNKVAMGL